MLWYISTYLKASAFKGENNIFPFFTLAGLSQREQLGRRKSRVTRVDCTKWNFPGSADRLAVLSGAESCSAWVKCNSKTKHHELFISSKIPMSSPAAAEAQITLSKIPIGQPKNLCRQQPTTVSTSCVSSKQRVGIKRRMRRRKMSQLLSQWVLRGTAD